MTAAGIALLAVLLLQAAPSDGFRKTWGDDSSGRVASTPAKPLESALAIVEEAHAVRTILPTPLALKRGGHPILLKRLPPRAPLSDPRTSSSLKSPLLRNPIALDAGRIAYRQGVIELPGVDAPSLRATCTKGSETWPCGRLARTNLRLLLRGRAIRCDVPSRFGRRRQTVRSSCTLDGEDLGSWVVSSGWARAADETYRPEERRARLAEVGIWR